jgi:hypothetical protein
MAGKNGTKIFQDWLAAYGNHLNGLARIKNANAELPEADLVRAEFAQADLADTEFAEECKFPPVQPGDCLKQAPTHNTEARDSQ